MVAHVAQCHIVSGREIQIVADYGAASSSSGKASERGNAGEGCRDDAQTIYDEHRPSVYQGHR